MRSWLRKELGWFVLAVTMLSLPGPASKACACARMKADAQSGSTALVTGKGCARCKSAAAVPANGRSQIAGRSCCKSTVTDAHAAETPAKVQLERHETSVPAHSAVTPVPATRNAGPRGTRAPPWRGTRDAAAPPASYLSDYLRL